MLRHSKKEQVHDGTQDERKLEALTCGFGRNARTVAIVGVRVPSRSMLRRSTGVRDSSTAQQIPAVARTVRAIVTAAAA